MVDRTVTYRLSAEIAGFKAQMAQASSSVRKLGTDLTAVGKDGDRMRRGLDGVAGTAGKIGLVAAVGLGGAVVAAARFDEAMSHVAATGDDARQNMDALRDAAIDAGARTKFSATEAAGGIESLEKAGVSAKDVLAGGLDGALDLTAAGNLSVADSADVAATAMNQFKLAGEDIPHIADLLAAAAGKAQGEVSDMAMALKQGGLVAAQAGLSIEETTGAFAALASQGLLGSDAGTSFKQFIAGLTPATEKAQKLMTSLGLSAFDAGGKFIGLSQFAGQLQDSLKGMGDEQRLATLETLFGSDAVRAASVIYDQGEKGIRKWITAVDDQGFAAETAATKMDNLKGDLEQFRGALETALIGAGEGSQGALRGVVQGATDLINVFNDLPSAAQNAATGLLAVTAVTGGGAWFGAKVIGGIADTRSNLNDLGLTSDKVKTAVKELGTVAQGAGRGIAASFEAMSTKMVAARSGALVVGTLALALNDLDESSDDAKRTLGQLGNVASGALLGFAAGGPIGAAIGGGVAAIQSLVSSLHDSDEASRMAAEGAAQYRDTLDQVTGAITDQTRERVALRLEEQGVLESAQKLGIATDTLVSAILSQGTAAEHVTSRLSSLRGTYDDAKTGLDAFTEAQRASAFGFEANTGAAVANAAEARGAYADLAPLVDKVAGAVTTESQAIEESGASTRRTAEAAGEMGSETKKMAGEVENATEQVSNLKAGLDELAGFFDQRAALRSYNDALDEFVKSLKKQKNNFDDSTRAGQDHLEKLDAIGESAIAVTRNMEDADAVRFLAKTRKDIADAARELGILRNKAIQGVLDKLRETGRYIANPLKLRIDGIPAAERQLDHLARDRTAIIRVGTVHSDGGFDPTSIPGAVGRAMGGPVFGPGTATSDSIPAWLSNNEHVWTAREVANAGGHAAVEAMRAQFRFAQGGPVISPSFSAKPMSDGDVHRIASALAAARPTSGDWHFHSEGDYERAMRRDRTRAAAGGYNY